MKYKACVICGKRFNGHGNNPWPVKNYGQCCDDCNQDQVVPARIKMVTKKEEEGK